MKIVLTADIPLPVLSEFAEYLVMFDKAHPGCNFELVTEPTDLTVAEVMEVLNPERKPRSTN